ncbi:MAG: iron-sulfur cluster insertion protein ErpA [Nitrospinota bacterium]|nr:iron-sulfur cluster insertion protein ErpA [Nitrospinota bacterium]
MVTLFDETKAPTNNIGITITENASKKVVELLKTEDKEGHGLRVSVTDGGCSGHNYGLFFDEKSNPDDKIYESKGFNIFVDPQSDMLLSGTQIDYLDSLEGSGFKINNPNATGTCGCGKSFTA